MASAILTPQQLEEAKETLKQLKELNAAALAPKDPEFANKTQEMLTAARPPAHITAVNADTKPFSFSRYLKSLAYDRRDYAPHEWECIDRYSKALRESGCLVAGAIQTAQFLPTNFETFEGRLTAKEEHDQAYRYVKAVFDETKPFYDADEARWLERKRYVKSQSAFDASVGGTLVAPPVQGEPIPLIRPTAAFLAAGAQSMTLPPNGRFVKPRIIGPPNVTALGESETTLTTDLTTGQMVLQAKKIGGAVILSEESTMYTSGTMDSIAQNELSRSLGLKLDAYGFYGTGNNLIPAGITSSTYSGTNGVLNFESTYGSAKGIGTNGNTLLPQYGDYLPALIAERSFNMDAVTGSWVMRPSVFATAIGLRADAVTANDQAGPQVDIIRRFAETAPTVFRGRKVVQTTNLDNTKSKGSSGAVLSDVFFGIWQYAIFASYGAIQFQQGHNGSTFLNGQIIIRGTMFGDIGLEYPGAFLWYTNVLGMGNNF